MRACSLEAEQDGVAIGMALRRALALSPQSVFLPFQETLATAEAGQLQELVERQSPFVEPVEQGHLHFDVDGLAALTGLDEDRYLRDLYEGARGDEPAAGAARRGGDNVRRARSRELCGEAGGDLGDAGAGPGVPGAVAGGGAAGAAEDAPAVAVVRAGHAGAGGGAVVLCCTGAVRGGTGRGPWQLANGQDQSLLTVPPDDAEVTESIELPVPAATSEPLLIGLRTLLQQAMNHTSVRGYSLRQLALTLGLESGEEVHRKLTFREPTSDTERMFFAARGKVERLELPAAATSLSVTLSGFCSEYGHQGNLWQTGPRRERELRDAIAQLTARIGEPADLSELWRWSRGPGFQSGSWRSSPSTPKPASVGCGGRGPRVGNRRRCCGRGSTGGLRLCRTAGGSTTSGGVTRSRGGTTGWCWRVVSG